MRFTGSTRAAIVIPLTALPGLKLERLSDQLEITNTLYLENISSDLWPGIKISAYIGNPPWGAKSFRPSELKSKAFSTLDFKVLIRIRYQSPLKTEKKLKSCNFPRDYLTAIERTTAKHAETKRFELLIVCIFIPNM